MILRAALFAVALATTSAAAQEVAPPAPAPAAQEAAETEGAKIISVPPQPARPRPRRRARAQAQTPAEPTTDLPAAVTEEDIAVTSDYRGFRVTVFGVNPDRAGRGDIVVALRGPNAPTIVRRKRQALGLWINGPPVRFNEAPGFLAVVSARPLRLIANPRAIWTLQLDPAASARLTGSTPPDADAASYRRALVRLRREAGLYREDPRGLRLLGRGLFRAQIQIPANAPIGTYRADVYLFRNQTLISTQSSRVVVARTGVERTVHDWATRRPFIYGVVTLLLALAAGWGAAIYFRRS